MPQQPGTKSPGINTCGGGAWYMVAAVSGRKPGDDPPIGSPPTTTVANGM
jgi:hypothetical protein